MVKSIGFKQISIGFEVFVRGVVQFSEFLTVRNYTQLLFSKLLNLIYYVTIYGLYRVILQDCEFIKFIHRIIKKNSQRYDYFVIFKHI